MTKLVGYQEHVSEYGEHWNFFFTLAAVASLTAVVRLPPAALLPAGAIVLAAHQVRATHPRPTCRQEQSSWSFVIHAAQNVSLPSTPPLESTAASTYIRLTSPCNVSCCVHTPRIVSCTL